MNRISMHAVVTAVKKVRAMNPVRKEQLADEIFIAQPNLLGSVIVQKQMGVTLEKMEFLVNILLICFQAMKESGLNWPLITEDDQDRLLKRYMATVKFGQNLSPSLKFIAQKPFIDGHPEKPLLAFVTQQSVDWLARIEPEETDKYVMMAAANLVECIAYVELPAAKKKTRRRRARPLR